MRELMTLDIVARDEASPVVDKVNRNVAASGLAYKQASIRALTYSKVLRGLSRGLTIYGGVALATIAYSAKTAAGFEHDLGLVRTQTDLTDKQFVTLRKHLLELATKTSRPLSELTQGLYDIFSGIKTTGPGAIKMLSSIAKAAQAGGADVRTVTRALLAQLNAFGLGAQKTNKILDQQFQLLRYSTGTYEELTSAIGMVQPSAIQAGQSLTEVNAALGFLTKAGYSFSEAATRTARALDYLTRPSIAKGLHGYGVEVFDSTGKTRKLSDIVRDFGKRLDGLSDRKRKEIFADIFGAGEIRANSFFNLATKGFKNYGKEVQSVTKYHGALDAANRKVAHTFEVMWGRFLNLVRETAISIGTAVLPVLAKLLHFVSGLFDWFNKLDPATRRTVANFILWSGVLAILLGRLAKLGAGLLSITSMRLWSGAAADAARGAGELGTAAVGTAGGVQTLGRAFLGTIGRFVAWGAAIAAIAFLIIKNWDTIKKWFGNFAAWWSRNWDTIKMVLEGAVVFITVVMLPKLVAAVVAALTRMLIAFETWSTSMLAAARANWLLLLIAAVIAAAIVIIANWDKVKNFFLAAFNVIARAAAQVGNFFIRYLVNPIIQGINTVIHGLNLLSVGFANISTIKPVKAFNIPPKFVADVTTSANKTGALADAAGVLSGKSKGAATNIAGLNAQLGTYLGKTGGATAGTHALNKEVDQLNHTFNRQVKNLLAGKTSVEDYAGATGIQAQVLARATQIEQRHLMAVAQTTDKNNHAILVAKEFTDASLKQKSRIVELITTLGAYGDNLDGIPVMYLANLAAAGQYDKALAFLQGRVKGVKAGLDSLQKTRVNNTPKINTGPADHAISDTKSKLLNLAATRVIIPIDARMVVDPYGIGYEIAAKIRQGARAGLQAGSPSKVFIAIGKDILRGLRIGLRDAAELRKVQGVVNGVVDVVKSLPGILTDTYKLLRTGSSENLNRAVGVFGRFMDRLDVLKDRIGRVRSTINSNIKDLRGKIKDLDKTIADSSTKAAEKAADILKRNKLSDELKKWLNLDDLPSSLTAMAKKLGDFGHGLQQRLNALNTRVQSFIGDFRQGFQQGTDIVGLLGGETAENINVRQFFAKKIAEARRWAGVLRQLAKKGLNQQLLQELAAAGPAALPLARAILNTGVGFVNRQQRTLNQIMGTTQKFLVNKVFGDQIDQLAADTRRFRDALHKLSDMINRASRGAQSSTGGGHAGGGNNLNVAIHTGARPADIMREIEWLWRRHGGS